MKKHSIRLYNGKRVAYAIYFKRQAIEYINEVHTAYYAATHFQPETRYIMILQCFVNGTGRKISSVKRALKKRLSGGGRKPALGNTGDLQADEIIELRIWNQCHRTFIHDRVGEWLKSKIDIESKWKLVHFVSQPYKWIRWCRIHLRGANHSPCQCSYSNLDSGCMESNQ